MVKQYINILFRWAWLLVLAMLVASFAAYGFKIRQPPSYQASARLLIGPGIDGINPDLNTFRASVQLMQTYSELATTRPVLQKVIDTLKLPMAPEDLFSEITVKTDETTLLLTILVKDNNAAQTVSIVNTLAHELVSMSPSGSNSQNQVKVQMSEQIQKLETDVTEIEAQIKQYEAKLQAALQTPTDVETRRIIQDQLSQQRGYLADDRRILTTLYTSLQSSNTNQMKIVELPPMALPVDANLHLAMLIAAMAGLVLAATIVFVFEYFNDSIRTVEDLAAVTDIPLLGMIAKHKPLYGKVRERLVVQALPESRAAESYRMLGSKLLLSRYKAEHSGAADSQLNTVIEHLNGNAEHPLRSVVLSSTQVSEDTSKIIANLAVILAQTGSRVILVDAYLHRPMLSQQFGIVDDEGLTSVLAGWSKMAKPVTVDWAPNLSILPSGPIPPNPFDLLVSTRMADLIKELEQQADLVLIAASPLLSFADSLILASRADGVIVVMHSAETSRNTVREVVDSLRSLNAHILGAIFDYNRPERTTAAPRRKAKSAFTVVHSEPAKSPLPFLKSAKS